MGFSTEWEKMYKTGAHDSIWPWSDVVSMTYRYFPGDKNGLRVLELGCGAGANIPFYTALGAVYCGIEGSITEVQKLQERFQEENVTVKQGDFTECLPWEGTFDLILDRSSVTHNATKDIQKTILLAYEKLCEGGYYFGLDWFSTNYSVFSDEKEKCEKIDEMYEKISTYVVPECKKIAHWNFVAKK